VQRRFLIITYFYVPHIGPRTFRWRSIAEQWAKQGYYIDIVTAWEPGLPKNEIVGDVHIHRVNFAPLEWLRSYFKKSYQQPGAVIEGTSLNRYGIFRQRLSHAVKWLYHRAWDKVYWPDGACMWYFAAVPQVKSLLSEGTYDAMISVSWHFTAHMVALSIHRKHPYLRWLVDIGDPFCFLEVDHPNNARLYRHLNFWAERRVFKEADAVVVTTPRTSKQYGNLFPETASKIEVIPPLSYPQKNSGVDTPPIFAQDDSIRLVYVGVFYKKNRRPEFLLRLFKELLCTSLGKRLELHIIGDISQCADAFTPYKAEIGKTILLHGLVSRDRANQAIREASVLVNVGNKTSYQLPSKVVDYASTGKPIVNLVQIEDDSAAEFFKAYPAAVSVLDRGEAETKAEAIQVYHFLQNLPPPVHSDWLRSWLSTFELKAIAAGYDRLLSQDRS
jgi:glycosyltransferase involved in cell wall biosynthesis